MKTKRISVTIPKDLLEESEDLAEERMEGRSTIQSLSLQYHTFSKSLSSHYL